MTEPTSDGTMRCPVPDPDNGLPCQKRIPVGWTADQGHGGGHWWQDDESFERMQTAHYDAKALLSGQPTGMHDPEDCPGSPTC